MSLLTCSPGAWLPFQDPKGEEDRMIVIMQERINSEEFHRDLLPTDYERKESNLRRILRGGFYDLEVCLNTWHSWVVWRHENKIDEIRDDDVENESKEGIFAWRGKNKQNMPCCVITGRMFRPQERKGTPNSFKKYLLKVVDDGMQLSDNNVSPSNAITSDSNTDDGDGLQEQQQQLKNQDKVCIIYDRRGLEYENIDPNMFHFCQRVVDEMRDFYSDRIGMVYVIHANFIFWILYTIFLRPVLGFWLGSDKIIVVEKPSELLEYFHEEDLLLLSYDRTTATDGTFTDDADNTRSHSSYVPTFRDDDDEEGDDGDGETSDGRIRDVAVHRKDSSSSATSAATTITNNKRSDSSDDSGKDAAIVYSNNIGSLITSKPTSSTDISARYKNSRNNNNSSSNNSSSVREVTFSGGNDDKSDRTGTSPKTLSFNITDTVAAEADITSSSSPSSTRSTGRLHTATPPHLTYSTTLSPSATAAALSGDINAALLGVNKQQQQSLTSENTTNNGNGSIDSSGDTSGSDPSEIRGTVLYTHMPEETADLLRRTHDAKVLPIPQLKSINNSKSGLSHNSSSNIIGDSSSSSSNRGTAAVDPSEMETVSSAVSSKKGEVEKQSEERRRRQMELVSNIRV